MKRILALFMCVMLICTTIVIPAVSVNADVSYEDYVPGEKPANMLKTDKEASSFWATMGHTTKKVSVGQTNGYKHSTFTANGTPGETMTGENSPAAYYLNGAYVGSGNITSNSSSGFGGDIDDGKSYVFAMQVRNLNTEYTPNIRLMLYDLDASAPLDSVEYGSAGMSVTSADWMDYKGTIQSPERNTIDTANDVDRISIGFNSSEIAGGKIEVNYTNKSEGMYPLYFAEEAAYDITNEIVTDSADIEKEAIVLKAEVINQIGLPGYLDQEITWLALDSKTRTKEIDGINIEVADGIATVTADEEVANGFYDIVAYSEIYDMAKGVTVAVGEVTKYPDYIASEELPANIMANNTNPNNFTGRWLAIYEAIYDKTNGLMRYPRVANPGYWDDSSAWQVAGGDLTDQAANDTGIGNGNYNWEADTTYILSVDLRNAPTSDIQESKFGFQAYAKDSGSNIARPAVFFDVVGSEWQTYTTTFYMEFAGDGKTNMYYGYPNHTSMHNPAGTEIQLRLGSFYLAKEVAKDINIIASETQMLEGGSLAFEAEITNQIDMPYSGETNIEWMVMDSERLRPAKGFSVVELTDNSVAVYSEKGIAEGGNYQIVAIDESQGIEGFCKGMEFTVIPYYNEDLGSMNIRAKLNTQDSEWSSDKVTTGFATKAIVEASLTAKDGDFKWYALDEDRISKVEGFTFDIVKEDNKETATVNLADSVIEGTYYIVAESADGTSLAGQKLVVDKSDDIVVIKEILSSGNKADIETGLNTTFLGILELTDGFAAKADRSALASIIATAAEEEEIEEAQNLDAVQEILERLALVSMYNVEVEGIELTDENGNFKYLNELKLADADDITLNSVFADKATEAAKAKVMASLKGKGYDKYSEFAKDAKEAMLLYTLAYPNVNGIDYIAELLTEENLEAVGIDATAYLALENIEAFNDNLASELYTIDELKEIIEDAEDEEEDDDDD